eukprot:m.527134 g.527134  ORF g.527134 m.527134 type:complete len:117 (+) comp22009_c1_seq8:251-601(+)
MSGNSEFGVVDIVLTVLQLITLGEVAVGMWYVAVEIKSKRGEFVLEVFRRMRDPFTQASLRIAMLKPHPTPLRLVDGKVISLSRAALVHALTQEKVSFLDCLSDFCKRLWNMNHPK